MLSVKANTLRFCPLMIALFGLISSDVATAQNPHAPWADDDCEWTIYDNPVLIDVLINDIDGSEPIDPSTVTIVSGPASGTVDIDPVLGTVLYNPGLDFTGSDQFQYTVTDTAGNVSNLATASIWVDNMPPSITLDFYEDANDMWVFYGTVSDEEPGGCVVNFGGLLAGETALPQQDGSYVCYVLLSNNEEGEVTAQATDELGEVSSIESVYVIQY